MPRAVGFPYSWRSGGNVRGLRVRNVLKFFILNIGHAVVVNDANKLSHMCFVLIFFTMLLFLSLFNDFVSLVL